MENKLSLKVKINKSPIHRRSLELTTYPVDEDSIIVEGSLRDHRIKTTYDLEGNVEEPGIIHDITVRILVGGLPLSIIDAEAEMGDVPHDLCPTTLESVKKLIGLKIKGGFSENVYKVIGGVKGCVHMTHLIITMGQEAVHGAWSNKMSGSNRDRDSFKNPENVALVLNSCKLWREGGPLVKEFMDKLDNKNISQRDA